MKGEYIVKVRAKDINNSEGEWSDPLAVTIIENLPPSRPKISGPSIARAGKQLEFTILSNDPEDYDLN